MDANLQSAVKTRWPGAMKLIEKLRTNSASFPRVCTMTEALCHLVDTQSLSAPYSPGPLCASAINRSMVV